MDEPVAASGSPGVLAADRIFSCAPSLDRRPALADVCEAVSLLDAAGVEAESELTGEHECVLVLLAG
jgi:hypothetical protein